VRYKLDFPDRVHFVMGNHDTACIVNSEVMKGGKEMNRAMSAALDREFCAAGPDVKLAIRQFLFSQPLAVRCANRIWISHSLPSDHFAERFDPAIFDRELRIADCEKPGSAYLLTWGRRHSQATVSKMARQLDVDLFVLGHQPQADGWRQVGENVLILACDHNHGRFLPIDLAKSYTITDLATSLVTLAAIE